MRKKARSDSKAAELEVILIYYISFHSFQEVGQGKAGYKRS